MRPDQRKVSFAGGSDYTGAAALFACVLGARLWLIRSAGSAVPFWDQWDAEALGLYRPWLDGSFRWSDLFIAHNEHRIALTRVADLVLLWLDGTWNPWWQMLLNAALHALAGAAVLLAARPSPGTRPFALAGLALLFAVPAGWQNALWGFQSQVYFGNLLAVLALCGLSADRSLDSRWWLGWLCALLALLANGAGLLVAAAALPLVIMDLAAHRKNPPRRFIPLVGLGALLLGGWWLQVTVPGHVPLRAVSLAQFVSVMLRCLAWPWVNVPWAALLVQAPALWFVWSLVRERRRPETTERALLILVLWSWLHAAAIAWSRGAGLPDGRPLSRYQDPLVLGAAAQCMILLQLAVVSPRARLAGLLWAGCVLAGILTLTTHVLSVNLPFKRRQDAVGLSQIRDYLTTRVPDVFGHESGFPALHPDSGVVRTVLDDPVLRPRLPREFTDREALPPWWVRHGPWLLVPAWGSLLTAAWVKRRRHT